MEFDMEIEMDEETTPKESLDFSLRDVSMLSEERGSGTPFDEEDSYMNEDMSFENNSLRIDGDGSGAMCVGGTGVGEDDTADSHLMQHQRQPQHHHHQQQQQQHHHHHHHSQAVPTTRAGMAIRIPQAAVPLARAAHMHMMKKAPVPFSLPNDGIPFSLPNELLGNHELNSNKEKMKEAQQLQQQQQMQMQQQHMQQQQQQQEAMCAPPSPTSMGAACENDSLLQQQQQMQPHQLQDIVPEVGEYEVNLTHVLGKGAFSQVFSGFHKMTHEGVAIKAISLAADNTHGYQSELKICRLALGHPHIVTILNHYVIKNTAYLVFELCEKGEVFSRIVPGQGLAPREMVGTYMAQLVDAVNHLHSRGIAHLDIKTENMLIDAQGRLKLCDFGLSALAEDGPVFGCRGSLAYAAPENLLSHARSPGARSVQGYDGQRADVWSCGVVLFVMLYGITPWELARETCVDYSMYKATSGYPNVKPWNRMSTAVRTLFHRTLAIHAARRFKSKDLKQYINRDMGWHAQPPLLTRGFPGMHILSTSAPS